MTAEKGGSLGPLFFDLLRLRLIRLSATSCLEPEIMLVT